MPVVIPKSIVRLCVLCLVMLLSACSFQQQKLNTLAENLEHTSPEVTLQMLEEMYLPGRDHSQYLLDLAILQHFTGDFEGSNESLQQAKAELVSLQAISVTESIEAGVVNETLRSYNAVPSERLLVHELLALNYLLLGDLSAARVEVLQADLLMRELSENDSLTGQLASARFLAGLIFELTHEWDDAMISYRKAYGIMQERGKATPDALKGSLLRLSNRQGLYNEYKRYESAFGKAKKLKPNEGELIVFYWDGVVSSKKENFISIYSRELNHNVSLALPYYPNDYHHPYELTIDVGGERHSTELLESIEDIVREDFDNEIPVITATALARIVSKHKAADAANQQDALVGLIVNLLTVFTEVADVRSWNMLPSSIQVARITVPAGEQVLMMSYGTGQKKIIEHQVDIKPGQKVVLLSHSVSDELFSYYAKP